MLGPDATWKLISCAPVKKKMEIEPFLSRGSDNLGGVCKLEILSNVKMRVSVIKTLIRAKVN